MDADNDLEVCDICSEVTSSLKEHLEKEHIKQEEEEEIGYLTQEYCQKSIEKKEFNARSQVPTRTAKHQQKEEGHFPCEKCGKNFTSDGALKKHLRIHGKTKPFECTQCEKKFQLESGLTLHSYQHSGERPFTCNICDKSFLTTAHQRTHVNSVHGNLHFDCYVCGKRYTSKGYMETHLKVVHLIEPFKCDNCGHNYATQTGLKRHSCSVQSNRKEGLSSGERLYECEICTKKFTQSSGLYSHMNSHMPSDLRPYECDICDRRFARNYHLNDHKQAVHEKLKPYHCQKCDKRFFRKFTAQHHSCSGEVRGWFDKQERTVTFKGPMNELNQVKVPVHCCPECGRTFNRKRTLDVHVKSHQLRPYKCHICRNSYIQMSALMEHRKKVHEPKLQAVLPLSISTEPKIPCSNRKAVTVHVKQSFARCEFCEKIFLGKASLENHKCPVNEQNYIVVNVEVSDS